MGNRRKTSPSKDLPKPKTSAVVKRCASFLKPCSSKDNKDVNVTKNVAVIAEEVLKGVDFKVKVFIDPECRLLAEQAAVGKLVPPHHSDSIPSRSQSQLPSQSLKSKLRSGSVRLTRLRRGDLKQNTSIVSTSEIPRRTTRTARRRKALTQAVKKLRQHPLKKANSRPKEKASQTDRAPPPTTTHNFKLRQRRNKNRSSGSASNTRPRPQFKQEQRRSPRSKTKPRDLSHSVVKKMDSPSNPTAEGSNNQPKTSLPESLTSETGNKGNDTLSDSSSDDLQIPVLDKPVLSDKEDEDDSDGDASTNLPDSEYESSLLSPSALPASALTPKKKRRTDVEKKKVSHNIPDSPFSSKRFSPPLGSSAAGSSLSPFRSSMSFLASPSTSTSYYPFEMSPGKRGRGRPRKLVDDPKSSRGKMYRRKMGNRLPQGGFQMHNPSMSSYSLSSFPGDDDTAVTSLHQLFPTTSSSASATAHSPQKRVPPASPTSDPVNFRKRLQRWKDRSTFVYARHKFVQSTKENKFRCATCNVNFTALSSLKRHYGTIYHKQQLGEVDVPSSHSTLPAPPSPSSTSLPLPSTSHRSSMGSSSAKRSRRASSSVPFRRSQSAAASIKKYYAAADAARRHKAGSSYASSTSMNIPSYSSACFGRKRKPLQHADFLYPSSSADSDAEEDERFRRKKTISSRPFDHYAYDNIENNSPDRNGDDEYDFDRDQFLEDEDDEEEKSKRWLSNVWKGIGPPHFTCEVCNESFSKKPEFTQHLFVHREEEAKVLALTCPDCKIPFSSETVLTNHYRLLNHGPTVPPPWDSGIPKRFRCSKCGSAFSRKEYYKKHMEFHLRPKFQCPHCPRLFDYRFYLLDHISAQHQPGASGSGGGVPVPGGAGANLPAVAGEAGGLPSPVVAPPVSGTSSGPGAPASKPGVKMELFSETTTFITEEAKEKGKRKRKSSATSSEELAKKKVVGKGKSSSSQEAATSSSDVVIQSEVVGSGGTELTLPPLLAGQGPAASDSNETKKDTPDDKPKEIRVNLLEKFSESQVHDTTVDSRKDEEGEGEGNEGQEENHSMDLIDEQGLGVDITWTMEESEIESSVQQIPETKSEPEKGQVEIPQVQLTEEKEDHIKVRQEGPEREMAEDVSEKKADNTTLTAETKVEEEVVAEIEKVHQGSVAEAKEAELEKGAEVTKSQELAGNEIAEEPNSKSEEKSTTAAAETGQAAEEESGGKKSSLEPQPLVGCGVKTSLQTKPEENPLTCQDCGKSFEHRKSLMKHVHYYRQSEDFPCRLCGKTFKLRHHVSRHMKSFHNVDTSSTTSSTTSEDPGDADFLNSPTGSGSSGLFSSLFPESSSNSTSVAALGPNEDEDKVSKPSTSSSLDPNPGVRSRRRSSSKSKEGRARTSSSEVGSLSASDSGKSYTTVLDESGREIFKCLECFKVYPTKQQLNSHRWYHNKRNAAARARRESAAGKNKFHCDLCPGDKCFTWRKDLLRHKREKHGVPTKRHSLDETRTPKEYQTQPSPKRCSHCPLVFPAEADLNQHVAQEHKEVVGGGLKDSGENEEQEELKFEEHDDDDDDRPPTPSPHTSPIPVLNNDDFDEEDEDDDDDDGDPSSPEFELPELN